MNTIKSNPGSLPWRAVSAMHIRANDGELIICHPLRSYSNDIAASVVEAVNGRPALLARVAELEEALRSLANQSAIDLPDHNYALRNARSVLAKRKGEPQ